MPNSIALRMRRRGSFDVYQSGVWLIDVGAQTSGQAVPHAGGIPAEMCCSVQSEHHSTSVHEAAIETHIWRPQDRLFCTKCAKVPTTYHSVPRLDAEIP